MWAVIDLSNINSLAYESLQVGIEVRITARSNKYLVLFLLGLWSTCQLSLLWLHVFLWFVYLPWREQRLTKNIGERALNLWETLVWLINLFFIAYIVYHVILCDNITDKFIYQTNSYSGFSAALSTIVTIISACFHKEVIRKARNKLLLFIRLIEFKAVI